MAIENDDQLVERLVPKILASIRSKAKAVESLDITADLSGITSIPCYDTTGEQYKAVLVAMDAIVDTARKPLEGELNELKGQVKDTVKSVKLNGSIKHPNDNGLVDLGIISGGSGEGVDDELLMELLDNYIPLSRDFNDDFNDDFAR
jgi:hypothetical protein